MGGIFLQRRSAASLVVPAHFPLSFAIPQKGISTVGEDPSDIILLINSTSHDIFDIGMPNMRIGPIRNILTTQTFLIWTGLSSQSIKIYNDNDKKKRSAF